MSSAVSLSIGYQGCSGCNSESAMREFISSMKLQQNSAATGSADAAAADVDSLEFTPIPHETFHSVFSALFLGSLDFAFVPIENSLGGSIAENFDHFLRFPSIFIAGEYNYRVRHCLMAVSGSRIEQIQTVYSHPQALIQCQNYIAAHQMKAKSHFDTAGAARSIAASPSEFPFSAAIAPELSARVYGLTILASGIEDEKSNFTRFLLLANKMRKTHTNHHGISNSGIVSEYEKLLQASLRRDEKAISSNSVFKTSIVFSLSDESGALFKSLSAFASRDISLSRIESRPGKRFSSDSNDSSLTASASGSVSGSLSVCSDSFEFPHFNFKYFFYLDYFAHESENRSLNALNHLSEMTKFIRILGSYKAAETKCGQLQTEKEISPSNRSPNSNSNFHPLNIAIVGFGSFGQFLSRRFVSQGHSVFAFSRSDYSATARNLGVKFTSDVDLFVSPEFCAPRVDSGGLVGYSLLIIAVSILSFSSVVKAFPWAEIGNSTLIVDVLSVKQHPKEVLMAELPSSLSMLCSHPMFGPQSGRYSWRGLPLMIEKVRIHQAAESSLNGFLSLFSREGCRIVELSCDLHDRYCSGSQFVTHTAGRLLGSLPIESTPLNTRGFESLLEIVRNTNEDSFDLYRGLHSFNSHSKVQLDAMEISMERIRSALEFPSESGQLRFNRRVLSVNESKTAEIADLAKALKAEGRLIIGLNIGELNDVETPVPVIEASIAALKSGKTKYTANAGLVELRSLIASKLLRDVGIGYSVDEILVSSGAKQSIAQSILALSSPGDEILIPCPYWVSYPDLVRLSGAKPVFIQTDRNNGWRLTSELLSAAINKNTRMLIICSPNNPSGVVYSAAELESFAVVLRAHPSILVLSDEIYEPITFDGRQHSSIAALKEMRDRTILVNGFSKSFAMTGFRLGFMAADRRIIDQCNKLQSQITSCPSSISQHAGVAALSMDYQTFRIPLIEQLQMKRNYLVEELRRVEGLIVHSPDGAFYSLPDITNFIGSHTSTGSIISDSESFCVHLLRHYSVAVVPGSAFGVENTFRIAFAEKFEVLKEGIQRIARCCTELKREIKK